MTKNETPRTLFLPHKLMDGVEEEVARFMRKLQELKVRIGAEQGKITASAAEVGACRRASQDVAVALREFRIALAKK